MKCKKCRKNYKSLTKEGICVFCYKNEYGSWTSEFRDKVNLEKEKKKNEKSI